MRYSNRKAADKIDMATTFDSSGICSDIDFVIPWVDGSDPEWQKLRAEYKGDEAKAIKLGNDSRYRDWGILRYWFRAVEKYAPWGRKIHFITCGQVPEWLNLNHPKLHFVKHEDYIPHQWLPTFSANPIELNLHRIDGLAEKFVYFNDDMMLNAPVKPEDFFADGLPRVCAGLHPGPMDLSAVGSIILNNLIILSKHFDFRRQFKANMRKWLYPGYGQILCRTLYILPFMWATNRCIGLYVPHTAASYLKSTFSEVWEKENTILEKICSHRFRDQTDVNQWLMEWWQIMSGNFNPRSYSFSRFIKIGVEGGENTATYCIKNRKHKILCLNDSEDTTHANFEEKFSKIQQAYSEVFPEKSSFEL